MIPDGIVSFGNVRTNNYLKPWMKDYKFILVDKDNIVSAIDECIKAGVYGFDTETTGLDTRVYPIDDNGNKKTEVDLVGICLSPMGVKTGYYIPLRHAPDGMPWEGNVPYSIVESEISRLTLSNSRAVFHNSKFDQEVLQFNGGSIPFGDWDDPKKWEDTIILAALDNSLRRVKGLKVLSQELLGKEMIKLKDLFGSDDINFGELDPSITGCVEYAASDAICTVELYEYFKDKALVLDCKDGAGSVLSQEMVYFIEKMCVPAIRWMERCRIYVDLKKVEELIRIGQRDMFSALDDVYRGASEILGRDITPVYFYLLRSKLGSAGAEGMEITIENAAPLRKIIDECRNEADRYISLYNKGDFGIRSLCQKDPTLEDMLSRMDPGKKGNIQLLKEYDVLSASQLGVLFHDLGVKIQFTEKGNIQTSEDVIEGILDEMKDTMPFLSKIGRVRSNDSAVKRLSNLFQDSDRRDCTIRVGYNAYSVETGRFSVKDGEKQKDPKKDGITRYNIQATPSMNDKNAPPAMLYSRKCFSARPSRRGKRRWVVAIDFSGVELRIITNFSREPKWTDAFFKCSNCGKTYARDTVPPKYCIICGSDKIGDLHTLTTIEIYGSDAPSKPDWKKMRAHGKATNFAMCFGGGPSAVKRSTGVDTNESQRIVRKFRLGYTVLQKWWDSKHAFARKHKYVLTAFGRKFPLPDIQHEENFIKAQSERNALNSPIQGCAHSDSTVWVKSSNFSGCCSLQRVWDEIGPNEMFEIWTGTKWSPAHIVSSGLKKNIKTTLKNGIVIQTSPDHKFLVTDGGTQVWKAQKDLRADDQVCTDDILGCTTVLNIEDTGNEVPMFDIQVHDSEHAFCCDGVIVHNSSADITKIAMGLIYRECKKRGWLDDVCMTITMHDELVFDVEEDILEEFCRIAIEIMTRNKAILSRQWPVPLTVDCEIGNDWSVPWNLAEIDESIAIRKILQNPETDLVGLKMALKRVDGFFGGPEKIKKKFKSFADIRWPKEIEGCFATGREDLERGFSEDEMKALQRAWNLYFKIDDKEDKEEVPETVKEVESTQIPKEVVKAQENPVPVSEEKVPPSPPPLPSIPTIPEEEMEVYIVSEYSVKEVGSIVKWINDVKPGHKYMIFNPSGVSMISGVSGEKL